jgi:hypothetical protein
MLVKRDFFLFLKNLEPGVLKCEELSPKLDQRTFYQIYKTSLNQNQRFLLNFKKQVGPKIRGFEHDIMYQTFHVIKLKKKKSKSKVCGLAIYIEACLKAKEELWKLKYFTMQKYNLQKIRLKKTKILQNIITL